ncbi:MAG: copper chaperone PCu(A)C [Gemmatimonadaceae bacterium]|nr:copper chaperone PCu(A)C [Gemmatimonadaceae bacterium]
MLLACAAAGACSSTGAPSAATGPWMRPAEQGASSAIYFTLRNPGDTALVLHDVQVDVAGRAMFHLSTDANDMASMQAQDSLTVPPHDSLVFAERGLHVMVLGLRAALVPGDTVVMRLLLRPSRVDTVRVAVRE